MLVIYYYIRLTSKLKLKITLIVSQLLLDRNPGAAYLGARTSGSCKQGIRQESVSSESLTGKGSTSKITHVIFGSIQLLMCCWTEGLSFLLAVGWRPPSVPCHMDLSIWTSSCCEQLAPSKQVRALKTEQDRRRVLLYANIRSGIHYFCCILCIRIESWGPVHIPGDEIVRGYECQEARITWGHCSGSLPSPSLIWNNACFLFHYTEGYRSVIL